MESLVAAIDELVEQDPVAFADPEAMAELCRQSARLDAVKARAAAAFDAHQGYAVDHAASAAAWLAWQLHIPTDTAHKLVRLGRTLRDLPAVEEAWLAGDITAAHVAAIARVRRPRTEDALSRDQKTLVDNATTLRFSSFLKTVKYWELHADPDGPEDRAAAHLDARRFHLSESFEGVWFANGEHDAVSGQIIHDELQRRYDEMFRADWHEAKTRLGHEPTVAELRRTAPQRRSDALVEMAIRSNMASANGRRPEPLFSVLVGYETFNGPILEMAAGTVLTPGTIVPWLTRAWIERIVFESPSRVIDVGAQRRLFTGATRRAILVRDRDCYQPTCDVPSHRCQVDHIQPWSAGGPTIEANGRPACGFHNRDRNNEDNDNDGDDDGDAPSTGYLPGATTTDGEPGGPDPP